MDKSDVSDAKEPNRSDELRVAEFEQHQGGVWDLSADEKAERAAIIEYEANLPREEAEWLSQTGTAGLVEYAPGKYF